MASPIQIVNLGLTRAQSSPIESFNAVSRESEVAGIVWPFARDELLRAAPWPRFTKRATLALLDVEVPDPWTYAYAVPADCIRILNIEHEAYLRMGSDPIAYETEELDGSTVLYCSQPEAILRYVQAVEDTERMPPDMADALAYRCAAEFATSLGNDAALAERLMGYYMAMLQRAIATASGERRSARRRTRYEAERGAVGTVNEWDAGT